jgi:hypothetical protein
VGFSFFFFNFRNAEIDNKTIVSLRDSKKKIKELQLKLDEGNGKIFVIIEYTEELIRKSIIQRLSGSLSSIFVSDAEFKPLDSSPKPRLSPEPSSARRKSISTPIFTSGESTFKIQIDHPKDFFENFASGKLIPISMPNLLKEKTITSSKNWVSTQKEVFTHWMSHVLGIKIKPENLQKHFETCIIPTDLIEKLTGMKEPNLLLNYHPKNRKDLMQNATNFIGFMMDDCNLPFVTATAQELVDGELDVILELIWSLILKFHIHKNMEDYNPEFYESYFGSDLLIDWINFSIREYGHQIENLKIDLSDGKALVYLLHQYTEDVELEPLLQIKDAKKMISRAIELAEEKLKIPPLITAEQFVEKFDLQSNITYLSYFRNLDHDWSLKIVKEDKAESVHSESQSVFDESILEDTFELKSSEDSMDGFTPRLESNKLARSQKRRKSIALNEFDVYSGLKKRRRDSISFKYQGDYLRVKTIDPIKLFLTLKSEENVLFSGIVTKLTDKQDDVIWVITDKHIHQFDRKFGNIFQKTIHIERITGIGLSPFKDGIFVIYVDGNDELFESIRKSEICTVLASAKRSIGSKDLEILVNETISYEPNPVNFNLFFSNKLKVKYITFWKSKEVLVPTIEFTSDKAFKILISNDEEDIPAWPGTVPDNPNSIYGGDKLRRIASKTRMHLGDYLAIKESKRMENFLKRTGEKKLLFANRIKSFPFSQFTENQRISSKFPDILLIMTKENLYICEDSLELKIECNLELRHILFIFTSTFADDFFLIKTLKNGDMLFNSNKKSEIITLMIKHNDHKLLKIIATNK